MGAIEELRLAVEKSVNLEWITLGVAYNLRLGIENDADQIPGCLHYDLMLKMGYIQVDKGKVTFTDEARDLYKRLKAEGFYNI